MSRSNRKYAAKGNVRRRTGGSGLQRWQSITLVALALLAALGACTLHKKPWQTPEQRTQVMVTVAAKMLSPVPNSCITEVIEKLKTPDPSGTGPGNAGAPATGELHNASSMLPNLGYCQAADAPRDTESGPVASKANNPCESVLRTCGNCHLPKANNCNYRVTWKYQDEDFSVVTRFRATDSSKLRFGAHPQRIVMKDGSEHKGSVVGRSGRALLVSHSGKIERLARQDVQSEGPIEESSVSETIVVRDIKKIEWLNGADPLETWWDFRKFSPRGKTALRMFDLVARHKVGCTNCHLGHGDFQLTDEGQHFKKTGKVTRKVSLEEFLRTAP